jgi:hypothetical protein
MSWDVAYVLVFVGAFVLALSIGGMYLEGVEARRESRRRNHVRRQR